MSELLAVPLPASDVARRLGAMIDRLSGVDRLTEQAFLQIGELVQDGHRRVVTLTGMAEQALHSGESESAEQTVARLQLLTERCALWLAEARDQSGMICTILQALERDAESLSGPLHGLNKVVKTLHALRVATRIEAARSHGQGGLVLGQELHHLGTLMQEKLGHIAERCEVLATLCSRALSIEEQAQGGPLREAESEIRQARQLLDKVVAHCVRTTDHTMQFKRCSTDLAKNFEELIAALQFQDITRQRLQHICKALAELGAELDDVDEMILTTGNICRLQYDQLTWAIGEFCEAVGRLDDNLRGMANGVRMLADDARAALFAGSSEQCARIAPSLQAVTLCLERVQTTHLAAGQAVFAVCQAVGDVAALTGEIERLGEEMQLLAQNAAVSAAHGSVKAAGLTVIAGNIQSLAEEAGRLAAVMADGCRCVSNQAEELDARDQQSGGREADLGQLLEETNGLIGCLEEVSRSFDDQIAAIGRQVDELGDSMQTTLERLDVQRQFLAQVNPVAEELDALAREHGEAVRGDTDPRLLLGLKERYTMMSERKIHQQFLQRQTVLPAEAASPLPGSVVNEELGSNVELF